MKTYVSRPELVAAMTRAKMCTEEKKPAVFEMNEDQLNIRIADRLTDYQDLRCRQLLKQKTAI